MNNNLIPKFLKGGVVPGGKKGTASNTRGSADRLEQQIVAKAAAKAPVAKRIFTTEQLKTILDPNTSITWKPLPQNIPQIPGVATVGKSYSSAELNNLNLQPNTFLIPQPSFTSKRTKNSGGQEYFTIGTREEATKYAEIKQKNAIEGQIRAEQEKWTPFEMLMGKNKVGNGTTDTGLPWEEGSMESLLMVAPLGLMIVGQMVTDTIDSFERTLSFSNIKKYGNFGSKGPGWKERGLYALEDALNVVSIAQVTKPFIAPGQAAVRNALTQFAIKDAARQFEEQTGRNLISMVGNAGKAAGAGQGVFSGGIANIAVKDALYTGFKSTAQSKYGMSLKDLLIQSADNLKYKDAVEVALAGDAFETGVKNTTSNLVAGKASSGGLNSLTPAMSSTNNNGLQFIKNIMADYQVAKTLIDSPMADVSAGINKTVLNSIGGKVASGVTAVRDGFGAVGSSIKYSKPVQSTLNAASLTLAGLSGKKGLEYGLMATGFKAAPLGITPAQLRSPQWISNAIGPYDSSLFNQARSIPDVLRTIQGQFNTRTPVSGLEGSVLQSYTDVFDTFIPGNKGTWMRDKRSALIHSGLNSPSINADHIYARKLLGEDVQAMLEMYYGQNLYANSSQSVTQIGISRHLQNQIRYLQSSGYSLSPDILRKSVFESFVKEFDPAGYLYHNVTGGALSRTSLGTSLLDAIVDPVFASTGMEGSFGELFRSIQANFAIDPANAKMDLASVIGSDVDIADRFASQMPYMNTSVAGTAQVTDGARALTMAYPEIGRIQARARQYLLTSNLTDVPEMQIALQQILRKDFLLQDGATGLQDYAGNFGVLNPFPAASSVGPFKSSLYLKSQITRDHMASTLADDPIGNLNQLAVFDSVYENFHTAWRNSLAGIGNVDPLSDAFPLWAPTWAQFNEEWVGFLDDFVASYSPGIPGEIQLNTFGSLADNLQTNPMAAEAEMVAEMASRLTNVGQASGDLIGTLENLQMARFNESIGEITFNPTSGGRESGNWFYGLNRTGTLGYSGSGNTVANIRSVADQIATNRSNIFYSMDPASQSARGAVQSSRGYIGPSAQQYFPTTVDHKGELAALVRMIHIRQAENAARAPFAPKTFSTMISENLTSLNRISNPGLFYSNAPATWSYGDELNIQSLLDDATSKSMPEGFPDVVRTILGQDSSEEFAKAVWKDWYLTKDIAFLGSADPANFNMTTLVQSPFDSKFYQAATQSANLSSLTGSSVLDRVGGSQLRAPTGKLVNPINFKADASLYHVAGRIIPALKDKLVAKIGTSILDNPAVGGLSVEDILRSTNFGRFMGAPNSVISNLSGSPIDTIIASLPSNPFDEIFREYNVLSTAGLWSADLPLTPTEIDWYSVFAKNLESSNVDLNRKIFLPDDKPGAGAYGGLKTPTNPGGFTPTAFAFWQQDIGTWLNNLIRPAGMNQTSVNGTTIARLRLDFLSRLSGYLKGGDLSTDPYYGNFFNERNNPSLTDPNVRAALESINEVYLATNAQLPMYGGGMIGGRFGQQGMPYARALFAMNTVQQHRMALNDILASYSSSVSNYAQDVSEHTAPIAPLIIGSENDIAPFSMYPIEALQPDVTEMIAPSALIELIGNGIKRQGAISSYLPVGDQYLKTISNRYTKFGNYGIKQYKTGGYVPGATSTAIPAILHGGEYVINADAVRNMGVRTMQSINQSKFRAPSGAPAYAGGGQTTNVSTVNINVDTFIGEEEWFKGMMKDYNVNVLPRQQKAAGLESRTFTSYNGIQGGF
jgi:hypothetical protein